MKYNEVEPDISNIFHKYYYGYKRCVCHSSKGTKSSMKTGCQGVGRVTALRQNGQHHHSTGNVGTSYPSPPPHHHPNFGTSGQCSSQSPFKQLTGTMIVDCYFHFYFLPPLFFSPSQPFCHRMASRFKNLLSQS